MNQQVVENVTRQNPKNYTHQLKQRRDNMILANNLVKIKPMVDNKMPVSFKNKQQQVLFNRLRQSSQGQQQALMEMSQSMQKNHKSLDGATYINFPNGQQDQSIEDKMFRFSSSPATIDQQYMDAYGEEKQQRQRSRGPQDSLMSTSKQQHQQSIHQISQHQGGASIQQSQPVHRLSRADKERQRRINTDNTILLNKMIDIMNRKQNKEQGLVHLSKAVTVQNQSSGYQGRQASVPDVETNFYPAKQADLPTSTHYLSDFSNKKANFQQVYLAPKLEAKQKQTQALIGSYVVPPRSGKTTYSSQRAAGGLQVFYGNNLLQQQMMDNIDSSQMSSGGRKKTVLVPMPRNPGTLNFTTRKKQIQKINLANMQMLKTLQSTKPTTSFEQWRQHANRQNVYKKNISLNQGAINSAGAMPNYLSQSIANDTNSMKTKQNFEEVQYNPVREFLRSKVKSGSLPARSQFYIHKQGASSETTQSKKAYSMHAKGMDRFSNKRTPAEQRNQIMLMPPPQTFLPAREHNEQMEVAQKIESVINMFPQPTEEQLEQFKELQESNHELNPQSELGSLHNPNIITNIQVYQNQNKSDHEVQTFNLDLRRSDQIGSQHNMDEVINSAERVIQADGRRVKTTMPGMRNYTKNQPNSGPQTPYEVQRDSPEKEYAIEMDNIQQPQSTSDSVNSQTNVPQIIVRKNAFGPAQVYQQDQIFSQMLMSNNQNQQQYHRTMFYPQQYQLSNGWTKNVMQDEQTAPKHGFLRERLPKNSFFDYQYEDGPDYTIRFDKTSGQPILSSMNAITMNGKLVEMQKEIEKRMLDRNQIAEQTYIAMKEQKEIQKQKNVQQILRAYAQNNAQGPYGTNVSVINYLQQQRKMPLHLRKGSRSIRRTREASVDEQTSTLIQPKINRKLRAAQTQHQSPQIKKLSQSIQNKFIAAPVTSSSVPTKKPATQQNTATRPRAVRQPTIEHDDDQVGGGPVIVSPEILRLQANRPDERQQRNRTRVVSPLAQEKEPTVAATEIGRQNKPSSQGGQRQLIILDKTEGVEKDKKAIKNSDVARSAGGVIIPSIVNSPQPYQNKKQSEVSRANTNTSNQRSSVEEGIMGLKYLPQHSQQTQDNQLPMGITQVAQFTKNRESEKASYEQIKDGMRDEEIGLDQNPKLYLKERMAKFDDAPIMSERINSHKTNGTNVRGVSPKLVREKQEDEAFKRSSSSQPPQPSSSSNTFRKQSESDAGITKMTQKNSTSNIVRTTITHKKTQVDVVGLRHIEGGRPIPVDPTERNSAITELNQQERGLGIEASPIVAVNQNEVGRQSIATRTSGQPYSDFEEEDDQAAVGSGVMETHQNYDDDQEYQDDDENAEFEEDYNGHSDSAGEKSLQTKPIGLIAALVQKTMQKEESNSDQLSGDAIEYKQSAEMARDSEDEYEEEYAYGVSAAEIAQTDSYSQQDPDQLILRDGTDDEDYADEEVENDEEEDYIENAEEEIDNADLEVDDENEEGEDEYSQDEFEDKNKKVEGQTSSEDPQKMSLESDQEAPENEFEQIKDDEYADEDYEQGSDRY